MPIEPGTLDQTHHRRRALGGSCMPLGSFKAMKAGAGEVNAAEPYELAATSWWHPFRSCSLSQRCSTLAFMPWPRAMAAMEAPGCWQAATSSALT